MSKKKIQVPPARPKRVIEQRGSLTFDSYLCCGHRWSGSEHLRERSQFCQDCGAVCTRDERGTIVEYDRDADFLHQKKGPSTQDSSVV